eukprot:RCo008210
MEAISQRVSNAQLLGQISTHINAKLYDTADVDLHAWSRLSLLPVDCALAVEEEFSKSLPATNRSGFLMDLIDRKEKTLQAINNKLEELRQQGLLDPTELEEPTVILLFTSPVEKAVKALETVGETLTRRGPEALNKSQFLHNILTNRTPINPYQAPAKAPLRPIQAAPPDAPSATSPSAEPPAGSATAAPPSSSPLPSPAGGPSTGPAPGPARMVPQRPSP